GCAHDGTEQMVERSSHSASHYVTLPPASMILRNTRSCIHFVSHHSTGLTAVPLTSTVKCKWSPAASPVMPLRPMTCPLSTLSPTFSPIDDRWPYNVCTPRP